LYAVVRTGYVRQHTVCLRFESSSRQKRDSLTVEQQYNAQVRILLPITDRDSSDG